MNENQNSRQQPVGISSLPRLVPDFASARSLYDDSKTLYEKGADKWGQKLLYAAPWPPSSPSPRNIDSPR